MTRNAIIQEVTTSLLALLAIVGTFAIIAFLEVNAKPIQLPDVVIAYDFSIIAFYFGKVSATNGARQAGTAAAQTAIDATIGGQGGGTNVRNTPSVP